MPPGKSLKVLDFLVKFPGPGKSRKMTMVFESHENYIWQSWKHWKRSPLEVAYSASVSSDCLALYKRHIIISYLCFGVI